MWQSLGFIPAPQNKTSWDCTYQASGIFSDLDGLSWPFLFSSLWSGCPLVAQMNSTSQYLLQIIIKCLPSKQQNRNRRDRERSSSIFLLSPFSLSLGDPHKKNYKQWRETSDVSRHSQALDSAAACMQENEALNVQYVRVSSGVVLQHWLSQCIFGQGQPQGQAETDTGSKGKGSWVWWLTAPGKWEEGQELKTTRGYMRFHSRKQRKKEK